MPIPQFEPYVPRKEDSLEGKIKGMTNSYFEMVGNLNWLMQHLDEQNVIRARGLVADWVYAGKITADQINGGTITGVTINVNTDLNVGNNIHLGPAGTSDTRVIYFNDYMNITAKADNGWVIQFYCGILDFTGNVHGDWQFSTASRVAGLESHGYATQQWVTDNFVHK
jgi:hypothetical protein